MPSKGWQHGCHVQLAFACQYFLLQFLLPVNPALWQRTTKTVEVGHAVPREVCGTAEIGAYFVVGHPHLAPYFLPHSLLPRKSQRHVHAVERHPINETLPLPPLPPHHGVAVGAVVEEESGWHSAFAHYGFIHIGQLTRQLYGLASIPRHVGLGILLEVVV